jgi:hypothetical protein
MTAIPLKPELYVWDMSYLDYVPGAHWYTCRSLGVRGSAGQPAALPVAADRGALARGTLTVMGLSINFVDRAQCQLLWA